MLDILCTLAEKTSGERVSGIVAAIVMPIVGGVIAAALGAIYWKSPERFVRWGWSLWLGSAALLGGLFLTRKLWISSKDFFLGLIMIILCVGGVIGFILGASMVGISEKEKRLREKE